MPRLALSPDPKVENGRAVDANRLAVANNSTGAHNLSPDQEITLTAVAGARFDHSRHGDDSEDQPLGFIVILPRFTTAP